ncbi:MAG: DUF2750 domain-containing protein [Candidatus Kapaibacterium sp.]
MKADPNPKEIETVVTLSPFDRYKYFIKKVADWESLYTLMSIDGDIAVSSIEEKVMVPFWPTEQYARLCLNDHWENYVVTEVSLPEFEENYLDFITTNNFLINVFPVNHKTGFVVDLEELTRDLNDELDNY